MSQSNYISKGQQKESSQEIESTDQFLTEFKELRKEVELLKKKNIDLEILLENTTEHSTQIEIELHDKNKEMSEYIRHVYCVTTAAAAVEEGTFESTMLEAVTSRKDELGQLARVFQSMVKQIKRREETLKRQVEELKIEIDQTKRAQQVSQIVETDYFQDLKQKAKRIRGSSDISST